MYVFAGILLLDEPTSALDAFTARYLVNLLREIAHSGKIVILTIHQPRSDIFKMLDNVMILNAGEMVFSGPRDRLVPYFTDAGFPCPDYANPLDYYSESSINTLLKLIQS